MNVVMRLIYMMKAVSASCLMVLLISNLAQAKEIEGLKHRNEIPGEATLALSSIYDAAQKKDLRVRSISIVDAKTRRSIRGLHHIRHIGEIDTSDLPARKLLVRVNTNRHGVYDVALHEAISRKSGVGVSTRTLSLPGHRRGKYKRWIPLVGKHKLVAIPYLRDSKVPGEAFTVTLRVYNKKGRRRRPRRPKPTAKPTVEPTVVPTAQPTAKPTVEPTVVPTVEPTVKPTVEPTVVPTVEPTVKPTDEPTVVPTVEPTVKPTVVPTLEPTPEPTVKPTVQPTVAPTIIPDDGGTTIGQGNWSVRNAVVHYNDQAVFPLGFYYVTYGGRKAQRMADVSKMASAGFNFIHTPIDRSDDEFFDHCAAEGVNVVLEFNDTPTDMVRQFKDHPALAFLGTFDDVDAYDGDRPRYTPEEVVAACADYKTQAPKKLTYISGGYAKRSPNYAGTSEVMGFQSYPVPAEPLSATTSGYYGPMESVLAEHNQAYIANLQSFGWYGTYRWPTTLEMRNMTYQALITGVKGILYYTYYDAVNDVNEPLLPIRK